MNKVILELTAPILAGLIIIKLTQIYLIVILKAIQNMIKVLGMARDIQSNGYNSDQMMYFRLLELIAFFLLVERSTVLLAGDQSQFGCYGKVRNRYVNGLEYLLDIEKLLIYVEFLLQLLYVGRVHLHKLAERKVLQFLQFLMI